jgi:hypothetical protein
VLRQATPAIMRGIAGRLHVRTADTGAVLDPGLNTLWNGTGGLVYLARVQARALPRTFGGAAPPAGGPSNVTIQILDQSGRVIQEKLMELARHDGRTLKFDPYGLGH